MIDGEEWWSAMILTEEYGSTENSVAVGNKYIQLTNKQLNYYKIKLNQNN